MRQRSCAESPSMYTIRIAHRQRAVQLPAQAGVPLVKPSVCIYLFPPAETGSTITL